MRFETIKSSRSMKLLPSTVMLLHALRLSMQGSESTNISGMFIATILVLFKGVSSIQNETMFSNTAITVENDANIIKRKNSAPIILPPGIALKIDERVVKRNPEPTVPASAVTPLL